jgi:hypothetical protein
MRTILFYILLLFFDYGHATAQMHYPAIIGQTPGGSGYHVNWDEPAGRLIIGCGTSIWIFDMTDPSDPVKIRQRPLLGPVNETAVYGDILFVAATHDGVYALDYESPDLEVIAHYDMRELGDTAAYGMFHSNDTLFIADYYQVRILVFDSLSQFNHIGSFGGERAFAVSRRGNYVAVGGHQLPLVSNGSISIYHLSDLSAPLAVWSSPWINWVQDLQFADQRDDILYICGGPETALFNKSNFFALQFDGMKLWSVDTFSVSNGIPGYAQQNIINMDSRNDTLFVATTAAWDINHLPLTYIPVIDANGLPDSSMMQIAKVTPGLWHFDVSLMHGTPYLAMSSEWLGVLISDVSELAFMDTLGFIKTGGWVTRSKVRDNMLWVCSEGYGMIAYDIDSLHFENGFWCESSLTHIHNPIGDEHFFSTDLEFLNDTLIMLNNSEVYSIPALLQGGQTVPVYEMNKHITSMKNVFTGMGQRMVATTNLLLNTRLEVFDPFDEENNYKSYYSELINNTYTGYTVSGDTIYYGKKMLNTWYLMAAKVTGDTVEKLDSIVLSMPWGFLSWHDVTGIAVDNGIIAVAYGRQFAVFYWNEEILEELYCDYANDRMAMDVALRNNYLYVADKFYGLRVFDVSSPDSAILVAQTRGSGGWLNVYGSQAVTLDSNNMIYLADFNAGILIIEAFDPLPVSIPHNSFNHGQMSVSICPNPFDKSAKMVTAENLDNAILTVYDANGRIMNTITSIFGNQIELNGEGMVPGVYIFSLVNKGRRAGGKFIIK